MDGFLVDSRSPHALAQVLGAMNADPERFLTPPPRDEAPLRRAGEQGRELLALYRALLAS